MKKLLAFIAVLGVMCCLFAGCSETEVVVESTATPGAVSTPVATELPDVDIVHDETKFVMDGVILKAYIGSEENVEIPDGTVIIDDNAFRDCTTVKTITFKNSVTEIGDYAFYGCTSLTEISVPAMVTTIGDYAFAECTSLVSFESKTNASDVGKAAFYNCSSLEKAVLSKNISVLADSMFEGCVSLKTVDFDDLKELGDRAFYGCESLTGISANVLEIVNDEVFFGCTSFSDIDGLSNVKMIGYDVFTGTKWFDEVKQKAINPEKQEDSFVIIGDKVLVYFSNVILPTENSKDALDPSVLKIDDKVVSIASNAFVDCAESFTKLELDSSVTYLGKGAFKNFKNLEYAVLSKSISVIPESCFDGCENLITVIVPGNITEVGANAFNGCAKLSAIAEDEPEVPEKDEDTSTATVPEATAAPETAAPEASAEPASESENKDETDDTEATPSVNVHNVECVIDLSNDLVTIGDYAFSGCSSIQAINLADATKKSEDKLLSIGNYAFYNCSSLNIEDTLVAFGKSLNYVGVSAFDGTAWFDSFAGGFLIIGDGVLVKAPGGYDFDLGKEGKTDAELAIKHVSATLGAGFTVVGEKLFYDRDEAVSIVIPDGVTTIKAYAFYHAKNLKNIVIPDSVTTIEANAFAGCINLETISLPEGITEIADYAFYGCAKLKNIIIPSSVERIGKYAFYNCIELEHLNIPETVKEIGAYAFDGTVWFELNNDKFMVVGDGLLIKYNGYDENVTFTESDPVINMVCGGAFEGVYRVKTVALPDTCKTIGDYAFNGATIIDKITSSATVIGERAFNNCFALTDVTYADGAEIADDAYEGCPAFVG